MGKKKRRKGLFSFDDVIKSGDIADIILRDIMNEEDEDVADWTSRGTGYSSLQKHYDSASKNIEYKTRKAIIEFIEAVFVDFYEVYPLIHNSKHKAQIEQGVMEYLKDIYFSNVSPASSWHPDKTLEWTSRILHWLLNSGKTLEYKEKHNYDYLNEKDIKKIVKTLDVEPFKGNNMFEKIYDGTIRTLTDEYLHSPVDTLIEAGTDGTESEMSEKMLQLLTKSMTGNIIKIPCEMYIDINKDVLNAVTRNFRTIVRVLRAVYKDYTRLYKSRVGVTGALEKAAISYSHQHTLSDFIEGFELASKYGVRKLTIPMINNAIQAKKLIKRDKLTFDKSNISVIIDIGV